MSGLGSAAIDLEIIAAKRLDLGGAGPSCYGLLYELLF